MTNASIDSTDKLSVDMMRKLINESKFGGKHSQHVYVHGDQPEANNDTEELETPKEEETENTGSDKFELKTGISLINDDRSQMTPTVNKK